eukprot:TRINITY_DN6176_c0_g1_i1.p1 TRINITY_DN6176_c0_g1~~TRINITY_DN6176_c0_g1_i1.p1  ORF type:complete len:239 (+),score=22.35 TRINITY_DN6176_c0_g1_i1:181-897(+)
MSTLSRARGHLCFISGALVTPFSSGIAPHLTSSMLRPSRLRLADDSKYRSHPRRNNYHVESPGFESTRYTSQYNKLIMPNTLKSFDDTGFNEGSHPRGEFDPMSQAPTRLTPFTVDNIEARYHYLRSLPLTYPIHSLDTLLNAASQTATGYFKPLGPLRPLPFHVRRTVFDNVLVDLRVRAEGPPFTVVHGLMGDRKELIRDLQHVANRVRIENRASFIIMRGNRHEDTLLWLWLLGF